MEIVDILRLPEGEPGRFRQILKESNGQVTILVHPFMGEEDPNDEFPMTEGYRLQRDEIIYSCISMSQPLIIFEEIEAHQKLVDRFRDQREGRLYVVFTKKGVAVPANETSDKFVNLLKETVVKHAVIGGRYMVLQQVEDNEEGRDHWDALWNLKQLGKDKPRAQEWLSRDVIPLRCPGQVIRWLLPFCDVSLSPASSPDNLSN